MHAKLKDCAMKNIVVRFCGDSGDGMQLTGNMFAQLGAELGHEISTLPDFPAEIRAPQGTLGGVSGFQVELGSEVYTPGDKADVIVAMNAAALKVCTLGSHFNHPQAHFDEQFALFHRNAIVIVDTDSLTDKDLEKAQYHTDNPFTELGIPESVQIVPVALTTLTKEALKDSGMDNKSVLKCRNMFALGLIYWLFDEPMEKAIHLLEDKFKKKPALIAPNTKVMVDGYNYGQNLALNITQFHLEGQPSEAHGTYTSIAGNRATAFGLIAAAEKSGKHLFLGSYPITPATDILHELAARKDMNVMAIQAEDEIAGVCTAIGAAFAGDLACTTTSGPGLSLKSEAIGLAVMAELPLVVVDVQRGGPSTGLPTKTEQTDLLQALYGRNGECPAVVLAASSSANCFDYAYEACKIALENMTPVILMTDTYLANGTALWRIPKLAELPEIKPQSVPEELKGKYNPALRDERGVRYWAYPGMEGYEHRNIGLERDAQRGTISTNPENHEQMVLARKHKIEQIAISIPELKVIRPSTVNIQPSTLLVGWGSTEGHLHAAANELGCDLAQFNYINPLPKNTREVLSQYKRIIVCELNTGQFAAYLRAQFPDIQMEQYNEIMGQPFAVERIVEYASK